MKCKCGSELFMRVYTLSQNLLYDNIHEILYGYKCSKCLTVYHFSEMRSLNEHTLTN